MRHLALVLLAAGGVAQAAAPPTVVAVAPLAAMSDDARDTVGLQVVIEKGVASVPGVQVIGEAELRKAAKNGHHPELLTCDGDAHCLAELGKLVGASRVVAGEVGTLTEGEVVYLKAVDVTSAGEIGSTTAVFGKDETGRPAEARAAAYRMLAPQSYVGTLQLSVDVPKATIFLDGNQIGVSPAAAMPVAVGTHALRVTQEKYHDFVRFVDVRFDDTTKLDVNLSAFPIVSDEMRQKLAPTPVPVGPTEPRRWYQKPWVVAGVAAAALIVTGVVVYEVEVGVNRDRDVTAHMP